MTDVRNKALAALAVLSLLGAPLLAAATGTAEKGRTVKLLGKDLKGSGGIDCRCFHRFPHHQPIAPRRPKVAP